MTELSESVTRVEGGPGQLSRRSFLRATLGSAAAGALVLSGCGSSSKSSSGTTTTTPGGASGSSTTAAKSLTSVSLMLDFLPNVDDVYMAVANQMGYFADEGIEVHFVNPPTDSDAIPIAVGEGRYDFGCQTVGTTILPRSKDIPVLAIGGVGHRAECMFWLSPNTVTSPHDLVGKTVVNYDAADFRSFLISYMKSAGLSASKVDEIFVAYTPTPVVAGRAFAGIGIGWGEVIDTGMLSHKQVHTLPFFSPSGQELYGIPQSNYLVLMTSEGYANSHPDIVKGFVTAMARGYKKSFVMPTAQLAPIMNSWASTGANATGTLADNMAKFEAQRPYAFYGTDQNPNTATYMQMPLESFPNVANWLVSCGQASSLNATSVATNQFVTPAAMNPTV